MCKLFIILLQLFLLFSFFCRLNSFRSYNINYFSFKRPNHLRRKRIYPCRVRITIRREEALMQESTNFFRTFCLSSISTLREALQQLAWHQARYFFSWIPHNIIALWCRNQSEASVCSCATKGLSNCRPVDVGNDLIFGKCSHHTIITGTSCYKVPNKKKYLQWFD